MSDEDELNKEQSVLDSSSKEEVEEGERPAVEETPGEESEAPADDKDDEEEDEDDFGDFNDNDDDFDDFVEEQQPEPESEPAMVTGERLNCLNETTFNNSAQLQASVLSILQPITQDKKDNDSDDSEYQNAPPPLQHITPKAYFSERSESLWNQLAVIAPEVHPIDWKRSSIRRLLLVSLGVPLDLDEILPNKNTKRLVLPSSATTSKQQNDDAAKTESTETTTSSATTTSKQDSAEVEELNIETENSVSKWQQLANVSVEACEGMDEAELQAHVENLKSAIQKAESLFQKWETKKQAAEKDKEAFEGVIESLLEYAQRLRRK